MEQSYTGPRYKLYLQHEEGFYRHCAIGMVHYADTTKLGYLYKTFDYICKTSQLFDFTNMKGARGFQLGEAPKKTSNAGRPRKYAQQLNLNF